MGNDWMKDAANATESFYAGIDQQEMQGIHRTATMRIKDVTAIIARHAPSTSSAPRSEEEVIRDTVVEYWPRIVDAVRDPRQDPREVFANALRSLASTLRKQSEWVSVETRLPPIKNGFCVSEDVLTWDGIARHVGHLREDEDETWEQVNKNTQKRKTEKVIGWRFDDGDWYNVTHWQPLPSPPEQGKEKSK